MAGAPSALQILPTVKGHYRRSWFTAHATVLQAELMRGVVGPQQAIYVRSSRSFERSPSPVRKQALEKRNLLGGGSGAW